MIKIFSKKEPKKLLHVLVRQGDLITPTKNSRKNITAPNDYLQFASIYDESRSWFAPHYHIEKISDRHITQEAWIVIQGKVKVKYYDVDNEYLEDQLLYPGDLSITLYGGHEYEILEKKTLVYEFKTGPYWGKERDKRAI